MANFHALWTPPSEAELIKGSKALNLARNIADKSPREAAYIEALTAYYKDWNTTNHIAQCRMYEAAMESLHKAYPEDKEASILYALALVAAADPMDKTYAQQLKAGELLNSIYPSSPTHPGIIPYIIHTYDYPGLAQRALASARIYAKLAPASAHALHMPSHIFTRLGLWDDCIASNIASVESAKCYAEQTKINGHWDEELHGLDYLVYAYLQKGDNKKAAEQVQYVEGMKEVMPANFKVAYSFASVSSRYYLENRDWKAAAIIPLHPSFPWAKFPWQESINHFARLLGAVHTSDMVAANAELSIIKKLRDTLQMQKDGYKTKQVNNQVMTGQAWIYFVSGKRQEGLQLMYAAAAAEDSTEKHPVTPGEVLPARELLADMLFEMKDYTNALFQYETTLKKSPNRFNSLYGAGITAQKLENKEKAKSYFRQLLSIISDTGNNRPEVDYIRNYLAKI
jgi:tetratricopeptide (TPR) repeat protein